MRCATRRAVYVDAQVGIFADERAGGAGVIEMNVREKDGVEFGDGESARARVARAKFPEWKRDPDRGARDGRRIRGEWRRWSAGDRPS